MSSLRLTGKSTKLLLLYLRQKNTKIMKRNVLLMLLSVFMVGCSGDDATTEEMFNYTVAIMSPDNTDKIAGESVHLHINFDEPDEKIIHNISVVIAERDGVELYTHTEHVHTSTHYEHHDDVILDVAAGTELIMEASVWAIHSDSEENEEHEHGEANEHIEGKVSTSLVFTVR